MRRLAAVIGWSLLARRGQPVDRPLAVGSALAFASIDTWYAARGTISPVYLADATVELALAGGWLAARPTPR